MKTMNKRKPANEILVVGSIRMNLRQWRKLRELGGGKWVRKNVDLQSGDNNERQSVATHACELNRAYDGTCLICMSVAEDES